MTPLDDLYQLMANLLQQTAQNPDALPPIPVKHWPSGSPEQLLLEDLQAALTALQTGNRDRSSQTEEREQHYRSIFEVASDGLILHDLETGLVVEANPAACTMYGYDREEFVSQKITTIIHPDSFHQFTKYIQAVQSHGVYVAQQGHKRRDGSKFYVELSGTVFIDQGRSVLLSVIRDVSQRVHSEYLLQQRVEERTREQSTLLEISHTLASALELQPGLILDQLRVIIDYTQAGLFKLEDSTLAALAVRGPKTLQEAMPFQIRLENPEALTMLFNERRSTRIADVYSSDPPARFLRSLLKDQAGILLEGVQSWMWVPLAIKGRVIGAIGVAHAERNLFTDHQANLALTVANQAAITMVNAELYENAQTLAALQERQRLARNLHDAVNQSLFSAGLIAEVLPRLWERSPEEGRQSLEDLRRLTRGAQADMRLLLAELRPSTLTDAELGDLLRLLGNALAGRTNIPISVTVTGEGKLPAGVKVALYRLCQEGLNNIAKHAGASQVDIQLQCETGAIELRIRDDGRGFDPEQTPPGHYGLSMMRERATGVGATLSITSQPGHGTEIVIRWVETREQKASAVIHCDETGSRVDGDNWWEWVFCTVYTVLHVIRFNRSVDVINDVMGQSQAEVWGSDCWGPQLKAPARERQLCLPHQLRNLQAVVDENPLLFWPQAMQALFRAGIHLHHQRSQLPPDRFSAEIARIERVCDWLLQRSLSPPKAQRLQRRYQKYRQGLFVFLYRTDVEPTNNVAERALRPSVIHRRVTGGFRSDWGAKTYAALASVIDTAELSGIRAFDAIQSLFGPPALPIPAGGE